EIDVASVLSRLRQLEREHGGAIRCPERTAADVAAVRLRKRPRIDNMQFGVAMMAKGHFPKDKVGAAETGMKIVRQMLPLGRRRPAGVADPAAEGTTTLPFYAGCAIPQDHELHGLVHEVAAGFGVRLSEAADAACCGHPSRGSVDSTLSSTERVFTACPACDASLAEAGVEAVPLWDALTERAGRSSGIDLRGATGSFVPYVGCLADRDAALAALGDAAEQAGVTMEVDYPTLHNGCCGALGGMYRGATKASARLLEFAAEKQAPVVTTCVLCRDNLHSAARELKIDVPVHFWPEYFRAEAHAPEEPTDD
ncbi:MAG: heterodisulfide reductase-related iron-sulfur binding cluster, partial [Actinobacteria bacterium]|nr:heterodisulfide reductase-related iron-sulfur binding cluster [Actinomycetota bacterium]